MLGFSGTLVLLIGLWNARALMLLIRRRMIVVQRSISPGRFSVDFTANIAESDWYTQVPPLAVSRLGFQPVQKTPTIQISSGFRGIPA